MKTLHLHQDLLTEEKKRGKDAEDSSVAYLDQIEELTHKLTMAESKINQFEQESAEKGVKVRNCSSNYFIIQYRKFSLSLSYFHFGI